MNDEYRFSGRLFLRTPYYSFGRYDMERVPAILQDTAFRNALWLASPGFYELLEQKAFDFSRLLDKERHTVYKYYNRMCFRPTPFGGFAAFTALEWAGSGTVRLQDDQHTRLHLVPDQALISALNKPVAVIVPDEPLILNPTIHLLGKVYRFVKAVSMGKDRKVYALEDLDAETFYRKLLSLFSKKAVPSPKLQEWIIAELQCSAAEADSYILFLLEEEILYSPSKGKIIHPGKGASSWFSDPELNALWCTTTQDPVPGTEPVASLARRICVSAPAAKGITQAFYAAMERPLQSGGPGTEDQDELIKALRALQYLAPAAQQTTLKDFITAFEAKFDLAKVPLLTALDPDKGIDYANLSGGYEQVNPLKNLRFPPAASTPAGNEWTEAHKLLLSLWRGKSRDEYAPLKIEDDDLPASGDRGAGPCYPPTIALMFRKTQDHLLLEHAGGATATSLIGRFSLFSDEVLDMASELANAECGSHPDVLFADIGLLNDVHTDNINRRRQIFPYQIPVNVYVADDLSSCIMPEDLYLSVVKGELLLESKKFGKRVIPRLATAYNYIHTQHPVYRLLCDLQYQGIIAHLSFELERYFPGLSFYPRVTYGRVVLCCATWYFTESELKPLRESAGDDQLKALREFRVRYYLPRQVSMGTTDQQMIFDLSSKQECLFFLKCIAGNSPISLKEYLLSDRSVKTGHKPLAGQFVAFLTHDTPVYLPVKPGSISPLRKADRSFPLGSEWLYLKLYCTPESSDAILSHVIKKYINKNSVHIEEWFFIRYSDPDYHLRLRLRVRTAHVGRLLTDLKSRLENGMHPHLVKAVVGDTYQRELERYGHNMITHAEQHFGASSSFVLALIHARKSGKTNIADFETAFLSTYHILTHYFTDIQTAITFTEKMSDSFLAEFKADKQLRTDMDLKYRSFKTTLTNLAEKPLKDTLGSTLRRAFDPVLRHTRQLGLLMDDAHNHGKAKLMSDLLHMHLNRIFCTAQRQQEMLVYFCLQKYLRSKIARKTAIAGD